MRNHLQPALQKIWLPEQGASGNPSWEPLSHQLVKWYSLETRSSCTRLQTVAASLPLEAQMAQMGVVVPRPCCSDHALQQMPAWAAPGSAELMLLALPEHLRGASVHYVNAIFFLLMAALLWPASAPLLWRHECLCLVPSLRVRLVAMKNGGCCKQQGWMVEHSGYRSPGVR